MRTRSEGSKTGKEGGNYYRAVSRLRNALALAFLAVFVYGYARSGSGWNDAAAILMGTQLSARLMKYGLLAAAAIGPFVMALLFGRYFCSVFCPLGTVQELFWRLGRTVRSSKASRHVSPWRTRYLIPLVAGLGIALGIPPLFIAFDPISNFGRGVSGILQIVSGTIAPLTILFASIFVILLLAAFLRGRRFCDWCPLGTVLGLLSGLSVFGMRLDADRCISCGACERNCPTGCIDAGKKRLEGERCVLCFSCAADCPVSCLEYGKIGAISEENGGARRGFLKGALLYLVGIVYVGGRENRAMAREVVGPIRGDFGIMPPGAGERDNYLSRCVACQACVAACPVRIVRSVRRPQPELDYTEDYCQFSCTECGKVCPSGAIRHLGAEEKRRTRVALSALYLDRCVVVEKSQACGACAEVCPTRALVMEPYGGADSGLTIPVFAEEYCIGCGACLYACPAEPRAFTLQPLAVQTLTPGIRPTDGSEDLPQLPGGDDFPF